MKLTTRLRGWKNDTWNGPTGVLSSSQMPASTSGLCADSKRLSVGQGILAGAIPLVLSSVLVPVLPGIDYASGPGYKANCKQVATAMLMYAEANSGLFPLAYSYNRATSTWRHNFFVSTPGNWRPSRPPERGEEDN